MRRIVGPGEGKLNDYVISTVAAGLIGVSERRIRRMCIRGKLPGAEKRDGRWRIPRTAHPNLAVGASPAVPSELVDVPEVKRREALRRLGLIQEFYRFERAAGSSRREAVCAFAATRHLSRSSFWRWLSNYKNEGPAGLVDRRGGEGFIRDQISPEAFEYFKSLYLDQRQPTIKQCWLNVRYMNKDRNMGWRVPDLAAMYRYIKGHIPLPVLVLHREGLSAYEAKCAPYIERDPDSVEPGQIWVGDHSQFNCWIRHRDRWVRPWITAWQDMRSRLIVGFDINVSPNQTTILLAMKRGIEKWGPPDSAKVDNGRDYDSQMWTGQTKARRLALKKGYIDEQMVAGIYAMMEIGVSFAIPYHPQSKPIERFFDTLDKQFTKTIETYCGKDTDRRPDDLKDKLADDTLLHKVYGLADFGQVVGRYIKVYNNAAHTGEGMDGRSPAEVFESRTSRRVMAEGVAELLMRIWSKELKVGKNGVTINKLHYGQYNSELLMQQGRAVRAAYDPDDMREIYVYDAKTLKLITIAGQNRLMQHGKAVAESDLREAMRAKGRARKIVQQFRNAQLTANTDLTSLTLRAMEDVAEKPDRPQKQETIRPVRTAMDDQVREHERRKVVKAVKRASGAESLTKVLDMDFSLLKRRNKHEGVRLFDG